MLLLQSDWIGAHASGPAFDLSRWVCVTGFAKAALDLGLSAGLSVSGLYGPLKAWRERQLSQIFASGQTLRLQFPKEDLGFVYSAAGAAVCPETLDSRPAPGIRSFQSSASGLDGTAVSSESRSQRQGNGNPGAADGQSSRSVGASDRQYRPSCTPGGRLPHVMLQPLHTGQSSLPVMPHAIMFVMHCIGSLYVRSNARSRLT